MNTTLRLSILFLLFSFSISSGFAQSVAKTDTFKVYGNCDMCKENIEGSLKKRDGVMKKNWSPKTKLLVVTYDTEKINLLQIKQKIAAVGYDTDEVHGDDIAYSKLHKCCQYDRAK